MSKRVIHSYINTSNSNSFDVDKDIAKKCYRVKAVRALVINPKLRVTSINNGITVIERDERLQLVKVYNKTIPENDYSMKDLVDAVNVALVPELLDVQFGFDSNGSFYFSAETFPGKYEIANISDEKGTVSMNTLTRTLGFGPKQKITVKSMNDTTYKGPSDMPRNLYAAPSAVAADNIEIWQREQWLPRLQHFYQEINGDVCIKLNSVSVIKTHFSNEFKAATPQPQNYLAKISLGAPGLPSKRLLTSERNVRCLTNDGKVRVSYFDDTGAPLPDELGLVATLDILILFK